MRGRGGELGWEAGKRAPQKNEVAERENPGSEGTRTTLKAASPAGWIWLYRGSQDPRSRAFSHIYFILLEKSNTSSYCILYFFSIEEGRDETRARSRIPGGDLEIREIKKKNREASEEQDTTARDGR